MAAPDFAGFARACAALATGRLGWTPETFWNATYAELRTALDGLLGRSASAPPLGRDELDKLKKDMPDG